MFRWNSAGRWSSIAASALCLGLALNAGAQTATQGSIVGTVEDNTGAVIPNAAVTIHNDATNAAIHLTSDSRGYYIAPLLEPGTYTVSVMAAGFTAYEAANVTVQVGQSTEIDPHMALGSVGQTVQVSAASPAMNLESPDMNDVLNKKAINNIPINNRRWSALALTTPGVVSDSNGYGLVSIRGISPILNNVEIDGADDNQAFFSEERGRTREAYSTSAAAVREFVVNTGVYSAEYGRAAGGVINSVTSSGSNHFHGQAYFYDRESNWAAYNDYSKITNVTTNAEGQVTSNTVPYKPEDLRKIYGFTVGGPLIKDKLFFIYTFDQHDHNFPGQGIPHSPSFYQLPDANLPDGATCNTATGYLTGSTSTNANYAVDAQTCTLAARQHTTYAQGVQDYSEGIEALSSDLGTVPRTGDQEINTPKLDWQISPTEHLSFLYHRLRWASPGGVQTASTANYATDTWGNDYVKLDYGVTKLTSLIRPNISNELLYQYGHELDYETQQPYSSYTKNNLIGTGGNVPEVALATSTVGFNLGSPYYSYRTAYPSENKWQVNDILYVTKGNHSLKFGFDSVHNYDLINNTYESNGEYSYTYVGNYINDLLNKSIGSSTCASGAAEYGTSSSSAVGAYRCYADYYQGFGPPVVTVSTFDYAFFAQDNWKFSPRLTFELGLRYDYEFLPKAFSNLTTAVDGWQPYSQLNNNPSDKNNLGPRAGFDYDIFGNGKTVLRGGFGMYYGRITNGNIEEIRGDTGSPNGQYTTTYKPTYTGAPQLPNPVLTSGSAPATPSSYFFAPNLQNPMALEYDLALQQSLGHGTVVQLSYLAALGRELPNFLDLNLNPNTVKNVTITVSDPTGKGPLPNGAVYTVPTYTSYGNTALFGAAADNYQAITEMVSNINSNYNAMVVEIQNHSINHLQFDANYTWSHALDYSQNADTEGTTLNWYDPYSNPRINYGNSAYNVPNRFVAWAVYELPTMRMGPAWLHYATNGWRVDDSFQMQNGLPYSASVSGYNSDDAVLADWNGADGQSFIPAIGRNTLQQPRKIVDDARVQKDFDLSNGYTLQLLANIFNVANHQNIDGINTTAYEFNDTSALASTANYQTTYKQVTSSNNSGFLYTPREIEISARLFF
jgi:Carboxypeptidase regulatory-like domain/TonB-dependent Receptor Plug Domain/TonB dependent receptor